MYNYYAHDLAIQAFGVMFLCSSQETPCPYTTRKDIASNITDYLPFRVPEEV